MTTYHHIGVPSKLKRPGETYLEAGKIYITNPDDHPYRFEFLRFEPGSPLPDVLQRGQHVAFTVDDIQAALQGETVIMPPFDPMPSLRVAFILKDGVVLELMQQLK
ncbi:MAG: hypothetical protein IMZ65_03680 [Planctomycetes bacterium]|nr:hypothetical protein [Planctomycetota bacterium]